MPVAVIPSAEEVHELIKQDRLGELQQLLATSHPADIADLLDELPSREAVVVFGRLPLVTASEVLDETGSLIRTELVREVDDEHLADILDELPMDDAAEILDELPDDVSYRLLDLMEPEEAEDVRTLLRFDEGTAGRLMTTEIASLRRQWTAAEAIERLHSLDEVETLVYLYVVDQENRLIGVVPIRSLLLAQPDEKVEDLMLSPAISVQATADQEELAEEMAKYDYTAMPVVDQFNRLLGVVTVDDVLDVLEEEATEDFQRFGGSLPLEQPYFSVSPTSVFKKRIGWLLLLFGAGALTGLVTQKFEVVWGQYLVLAAFVPLIIGTGGNAGSQTIATIIRAITVGEVRFSTLLRAWRREISVGLLLGLVMGILGFVLAQILWQAGWQVALAVALTLPLVVMWSTTVGTIVPIVADRIGIDPAVISGPMISTVVDVSGLIIYYSLAGLILGVL
ncbi:MAG: magnesium transporter [Chloroflexota bacterium]|nr:magnesium transporter [Chloroflexota bacterium]